jgi:hypothetical protein
LAAPLTIAVPAWEISLRCTGPLERLDQTVATKSRHLIIDQHIAHSTRTLSVLCGLSVALAIVPLRSAPSLRLTVFSAFLLAFQRLSLGWDLFGLLASNGKMTD